MLPIYAAFLGSLLYLFARSRGFFTYLFSNQDSLSIDALWGILGHGVDIAFTLILFGGFLFIGKRILRRFAFPFEFEALEMSLFAVALGESASAFLILLLGFLKLYQSPLFYAAYFFLAYGAYRERKALEGAARWAGSWALKKVSLPQWTFIFIIGIAVFRAVFLSAAPATDWDSLAYHLAFPKIFLSEGGFVRIPWSINGHYPLNSEMIYLLPLAFKRELSCHWINLTHGIFVLIAIALVTRRIFSKSLMSAGLFAAALYAVQPAFSKVVGNAATDMNLTFVSLLAILAFWNWLKSEDRGTENKWGLLCGILAGIAMSVKLTGTWLALTFLILFAAEAIIKRRRFLPLALFFAGMTVCGFPWYIKNWIWTGNPIWPYLPDFFGTVDLGADSYYRMRSAVTEGVAKTFLNFISVPALLILKGGLFHYATQFLMLPFLALMAHRFLNKDKDWNKLEKISLGIIGVFIVIWFWIYQDWRYCLPVSALIAALIAGWSLKIWSLPSRLLRYFAAVALVGFWPVAELSVNNELFVFFNLKSKAAPGLSAKDRYLFGSLGAVYAITQLANLKTPQKSKVFFYRDVRGYYLDRPYAWGDPLNPGVFSYADIKNSDELFAKLRQEGFTHVLFNPYIVNYKGDPKYYERAETLMTGALNRAKKMQELDGISLYELDAGTSS